VVENYVKILGRERVINIIEPEKIRNILKWYISTQTEGSLPKFLRHRIKDSLGTITARYEVLSRYRIKHKVEIIYGADKQDIPYALFLRNDPVYDYTSHGKNKKYNRGYGPSRVDLGLFERRSVEEWAQWIGPVDHFSKKTMEKFYELYNQNVYAFDNIREAETMKPFENMMMEASLAISHLSMAIIQAIGIGDFYKYAFQTNIRPEVFIRLGGGGSSGFCQPKDIYFLPFVVGLTFDASLEFAGITADNWSVIEDIYIKLKGRIGEYFSPKLITQVSQYLDKAIATRKEELKNSGLYSESFMTGGKAFSISGNLAKAIQQIGFGIPIIEPQQFLKHLIGTYSANLFDLLEDRIRFSNIALLWQIWDAINHVRKDRLEKGSTAPDYEESVIVLPVEYKTVGDPRLSTGLKLKDLMVGLGTHLIKPLGTEGIALANFLLKGFNKNDLEIINLIAKGLGKDRLDEKDIEVLEHLYPPLGYPKDIRLVSPYGLTRDAVFNYVVGAELDTASEQARTILGRYLKEAQIKANILSYGAELEKWLGLNPKDITIIREEIQGKVFALVWDIRLRDAEYRNKIYMNLWESIRGSDVFCIIVHYMELTGPEDIDKTGDRMKFMLLDLARIRDTMRDGNSTSSLIIVDAPVQGRKPAFDEIAIKMWLALGGTYISPSIGNETIERYRKEVEEDKRISNNLYKSIISDDNLGALNAFKELKAIAYNRYIEADIIEKFAQMGRDKFRGGGFLNYSERHRLFREGWARIVNAQKYEELNFELLVISGLMYELNGIPEEDIEIARAQFENLVIDKGDVSKEGIFNEKEKKILRENFIQGRYIEPIRGRIEIKGERSSIKSRDINVQNVEGKAKAMARERKRVKNLHMQKIGFEKAIKDEIRMEKGDYFYQLYHRAKNVLRSGNEKISYEDFGKFLGYSYRAFRHEVEKIIIDSQLRQQIFRKIERLYNNGLGDEQEKWRNNWDELMGKEDVLGEFGRLALELNGDKDRLKELAFLAELLEILLVFILTFEFQLEERYSLKLSNQVFSSIQNFYSMTIYDHVMDYPPRWMTPSEIGPGFTDYDFIMGKWMRGGKPFNREEIISIAVSTHIWLKAYLSNLIKTKTWMCQLKKSQLNLILGNERKIPIGAGEGCYSEIEQQWNSYNQLRELSFLDRDGHRISWAFNDLDANELSQGRPFAAIISPIGRTHLTCYLAENGKYNKEFPEYQTTWILTRSIIFKNKEINGQTTDLMLIRDGLLYISAEEFRSLIHKRKVNKDEIEILIKEALKYNQDGILIAVRFKEEAVACFSMPFHGWITYQLGLDEKIGLPTGQEWISNYWMYDKTYETLIHPENCGVLLPEEHKWYMNWQFKNLGQGKRRLEADILSEILNGREGFVGLRNLPWLKAIAKASRQSGGRGSKAMQIRDFEGKIIEENIKELANHIMIIGWVDNQVIQRTLPASPRLWASKLYIDKLRQALIAKGVPAPEDSQYFSYVRIITVRDQSGGEFYIFPLVVTSRATISNVGRGGVLFELLPEYFINLGQYSIFIKEMERVAFKSLKLIQITSEELMKKLIGDQEVDEAARLMKDRILISSRNKYQDLTGWKYVKPRYMMFDLIPMPILNFKNKIIRRPEILDIKYDNKGNISNFIVLDTENWKIIEASVKNISGWDMILIENNVGYGLWHPFKEDQKLREYERAEKAKENINTKNWGNDLRKVMYGFSSAAWAYYKKIYSKTPIIASPPISRPLYLKPELIPIIRKELVEETIELRGIEGISKKLSMILKEMIGKDKIMSWRESWKDDIEQEIINELTQYTKENYTIMLKKLETDLGLHYEELLLLINDEYFERIYAEVCDSIFTERLIPDIIIYPRNKIPENIENLLKGFKYAFIFDGFLGRADNIYTFIHSAYIASERLDKLQSQLKEQIVVVGVNKNWLDKNGMIHRVLIYDFDKEKLIETDLYKPILPDKVAVRNLNENEIEEHRRISLLYRKKGINQLNLDSLEPLSGAARADDKWIITVNIKESVAVPVTICIEKNMEEVTIKEKLKDLLSSTQRKIFYIQIALGTEGRGIERYVYNDNFEEFVRKIYMESRTEKLIVREEVGNIRYQTYRKITFRINTSFLEGVSKAESGFVQIGALGSALSSPSRGGEIISFQKANDELFYLDQKGNIQQITLNENLMSGMFETAEKALEALNRDLNKELILQFAGIDIELELTPQKMIYYVLDINPRPAGLRHASNLKNIEEILPSLRIFQNLSKE
jgi:hypothetical protein